MILLTAIDQSNLANRRERRESFLLLWRSRILNYHEWTTLADYAHRDRNVSYASLPTAVSILLVKVQWVDKSPVVQTKASVYKDSYYVVLSLTKWNIVIQDKNNYACLYSSKIQPKTLMTVLFLKHTSSLPGKLSEPNRTKMFSNSCNGFVVLIPFWALEWSASDFPTTEVYFQMYMFFILVSNVFSFLSIVALPTGPLHTPATKPTNPVPKSKTLFGFKMYGNCTVCFEHV